MNLKDQGGASMFLNGSGNAIVHADTNLTTNKGSNNTINAGNTTVINIGGEKGSPPHSMFKMEAEGNVVIDAKTSITLKVGDYLLSIDNKGLIKLKGKNFEQKADNNF